MVRICWAQPYDANMSDLCVPVMTNSGTRIKHYSSGPKSALHGTCTAETIVGAGSFLGAC